MWPDCGVGSRWGKGLLQQFMWEVMRTGVESKGCGVEEERPDRRDISVQTWKGT